MPSSEAALVRVVSWSADGKAMFVGKAAQGGQPELWRVPVDGSAPVRVGAFPFRDQIGSLRVHPDGRRIAFSQDADVAMEPSTVWVLDNFLKR